MVDHGQPPVFVSHGVADRVPEDSGRLTAGSAPLHPRAADVLPIDACSRRLVPRLEKLGYRVSYEEFGGGHEVPAAVIDRAVTWLAAAPNRG